MAGFAGAMVRKAPMVAALLPSRVELITCRPGRIVGRDAMRPASFMNATIEPVNVIPPIPLASTVPFPSLFLDDGDKYHTDNDTHVGCHHVEGRDITDIGENASNTGHHGSKADDRVQCRNSLGKSGGRDPATNDGT